MRGAIARRCGDGAVLAATLALSATLVLAATVRAGEPAAAYPPASASPAAHRPVLLWQSPRCGHQKLGTVEIELGHRVSETTRDTDLATVDYARAMQKLAAAGAAQGADAVVLRWHQSVYFTRFGQQSRRPVYVKLRGAAIRLPANGAATACELQPVAAAELEARARGGHAVNVDSREAYSPQ